MANQSPHSAPCPRDTNDRQARIEAFSAAYRALFCKEHRLVVSYDGGYMAGEVRDLRDDDFFEWDESGWRLHE